LSGKRTKVIPFPQSSVAKLPISSSSIDISASSGPSQPALDEDRLRVVVSRIVYFGAIREAFHSAVERETRDISQDDISAMLEGDWKLAAEPDWDVEHRNWEYKLRGFDIEGDELVLKIAVNEEMQRITIITKY
jgi:hypothetical protein